MKNFFIFIPFCLLLCSCVNTKKTGTVWIPKGVRYYERINTGPAGTDNIYTQELTRGLEARVTTPALLGTGTLLPVSTLGINTVSTAATNHASPEPPGIFIPYSSSATQYKGNLYRTPAFKYLDIRPILQTLSIPIKFRPRLNDTINSTASASFNVGIAYGSKFTKYSYSRVYIQTAPGARSSLNDIITKWTFTPGVFAGPTIVDLKSGTTFGKVIKDRSVVGLTLGGFFVVGYNELNAGIALGFDKSFGTEGKEWMYNGKPWIGFVVAIDIIK